MFRYINASSIRFTSSPKGLTAIPCSAKGDAFYGKLADVRDNYQYAYAKYAALGKAGKLKVGEFKLIQDYGAEKDGVRPGTGKCFIFLVVHQRFNVAGKAEYLESALAAFAKAYDEETYKSLELEGVLNVGMTTDTLANFAKLPWDVAGPIIAQSKIARASVGNAKLNVTVGIQPTDTKHPNLVPTTQVNTAANAVEASKEVEPAKAPSTAEPKPEDIALPAVGSMPAITHAQLAVMDASMVSGLKELVAKHTAAHLEGEPASVGGDVDAIVDSAVKELVNPFPVPAAK